MLVVVGVTLRLTGFVPSTRLVRPLPPAPARSTAHPEGTRDHLLPSSPTRRTSNGGTTNDHHPPPATKGTGAAAGGNGPAGGGIRLSWS
ncbi:hypothetical protein Prubr_08890 [Polymorphospora rubra]|uniref:Uncharacterized protein n=1 Tax=Polymorphospora rubra TaxID=338584 RepID=A0A810MX00_9ACTN|nr:hypothetical protein Prubr_08890 [Polymorphospora rubra]